jgi:DNA mismatch repair ATPase MutL
MWITGKLIYNKLRLVECETIKKLIENVYSTYYASINDNLGGFFVYCSLNLKPDHVDHNVAINIIIKE